MSIKINLDPLESAAVLTYLGRTIAHKNSDWEDLYHNPGKERRKWGMVSKVLEKMGVAVRDRATMYMLVLQMLMFIGSRVG